MAACTPISSWFAKVLQPHSSSQQKSLPPSEDPHKGGSAGSSDNRDRSSTDETLCPPDSSSHGVQTEATVDEECLWVPFEIQELKHSEIVKERMLQEAKRNLGTVDLMKRVSDGKFMAVKRMPNKWILKDHRDFIRKNPNSLERPWYDIGLLRYLNEHGFPYGCKIEGIFRDDSYTYIATEFADQGDLFDWASNVSVKGRDHEMVMRPILQQIFDGVRWLHDHGISHRDLSLENILLSSANGGDRVKIIDYGMSSVTQRYTTGCYGKASYQSPEMHTSGSFDAFLSDDFAVGVVIFGLAVNDYPWLATKRGSCTLFEYISRHGLRKFMTLRKMRMDPEKTLAEALSPDLQDVLVSLLALQPENRMTVGELGFNRERRSVWDSKWMEGAVIERDRQAGNCQL